MQLSELVAEWMKYSRTDAEVARQLYETMHPRPLEIICYHAQQSAEKSLKAFLVQNNITPPKIHDLNNLLELCKNIDDEFTQLAASCAKLNNYSSMPRYPFEIEIFEADAETAINKAFEMHEWVAKWIITR